MGLKIHFPEDIEGFAAALDGISEATAQAAQDGSESLRAFRMGVQVALAAMIKASGGNLDNASNAVHPRIANPCPLKGIYAEQSNGYYCRFYRGRCPQADGRLADYTACPGWREYEAKQHAHACFA